MALKVLIIDPDMKWLAEAREYFIDLSYEADVANNGKDAQLLLYNNKYFAVILSRATRNHSGSQVLKFIKSNCTGLNVVYILEEQIEEQEVDVDKIKKMGATEVVCRPFEMKTLQECLEGHQSIGDMVSQIKKTGTVSDEVEVTVKDDDYTKVRITEFFSSKAVLFDIYVRLSSGRFVKILHAGDNFSQERIDKYKNEKKVEYLYFHNADRKKYIKYNNYMAKKIVGNDKIAGSAKLKLIKNVISKYIEEVHTEGVKPLVVEQGKEICQNVYSLIENQEDLYAVLKDYQNFDPSAYTHAFLVTLYSSAIIKQFEWQSKMTIENTALACMFHDIGKLKLPKDLIGKSQEDMTDEELAHYKLHPEYGVELIEGNRMINNSVKQIIYQHHEHFNGTGFPLGIKSSKIQMLANVVRLADDFSHIMLREELSPPDALKKIILDEEMVKRYNSMIIESFIRVFVDPVKFKKRGQRAA